MSKVIGLGGNAEGVIGPSVFNVPNASNYSQHNYSGANETFNPNYLQFRNQQPPRLYVMPTWASRATRALSRTVPTARRVSRGRRRFGACPRALPRAA